MSASHLVTASRVARSAPSPGDFSLAHSAGSIIVRIKWVIRTKGFASWLILQLSQVFDNSSDEIGIDLIAGLVAEPVEDLVEGA